MVENLISLHDTLYGHYSLSFSEGGFGGWAPTRIPTRRPRPPYYNRGNNKTEILARAEVLQSIAVRRSNDKRVLDPPYQKSEITSL